MAVKNTGLHSLPSSTTPFYPLDAFYTLWKNSHSVSKIHRWGTQQFFLLSSQTKVHPKRSLPLYHLFQYNETHQTTNLFIAFTKTQQLSAPSLMGRIDTVNYVH